MAEPLDRFTPEQRRSVRAPLLDAAEAALELGMSKRFFLQDAEEMWACANTAEEPEMDAEDDADDDAFGLEDGPEP
jgi:hypothetical protein